MQQEALEALDTPELDRLLQEELAKDDTNAQQVRQIVQVLENRDQAAAGEVLPEVQALFDEFVRRGRRSAESEKTARKNWVAKVAVTLVTVIVAAVLMMTVLSMMRDQK